MDKDKLKRYETVIYLFLVTIGVIFGFVGDRISNESLKSITLNLASELFAVAILFFIINRFFLMGDDGNTSRKILDEITAIKNDLRVRNEEEQKRQEQRIKVILNIAGKKKLELPVELRRAEFSRAEILGRIGMIPMKEKGKRFSLSYTNTTGFLQQINQILAGKEDAILTIPCDESEMTQFDLKESDPR